MVLSAEQVAELKGQLKEQVANLPAGQKEQAEKQIDEMSAEAIEAMLEQQKQSGPQKGVFRMIVDGEIKARRIDENDSAIAVLEIRPISRGHVVVIPKSAAKEAGKLSKQVLSLANSAAKKIVSKLKAQKAEILEEAKFGEVVVNVVPIYDKPLDLVSPRYEAKEDELEEVYKKLKVVKKPKKERIKIKKVKTEVLKMRRRVP